MVINIALRMVDETISSKSLVGVSKKLKKRYPNWLLLVASGISEDKEWKMVKSADCTRENARHISTGTIKSQFHRRVFMRVSANILLSAERDAEKLQKLVSKTHKQRNGQRQIKSIKVH